MRGAGGRTGRSVAAQPATLRRPFIKAAERPAGRWQGASYLQSSKIAFKALKVLFWLRPGGRCRSAASQIPARP